MKSFIAQPPLVYQKQTVPFQSISITEETHLFTLQKGGCRKSSWRIPIKTDLWSFNYLDCSYLLLY